jgi:general secretion pathway protein L
MSSLYLLLPSTTATPQTEFAFVVSPDGRSVVRHGSAAAALLPPVTGAGAEVVAVAPVAALSWHRVELPKGVTARSPRLRPVLEGLLEDRLLDEPEELHFALEPRPAAEGAAWVAVCNRVWLRSALQVLEAAGRPVSRVVPEFAPEGAPALAVQGEAEHPQLVCAWTDGVITLPLAHASLPLLPALPENTPLVAEPAVAAAAEQVLGHSPRLQPAHLRVLASAQTAWDLGQGEFASSSRTRAFKKLSTGWGHVLRAPQWRPARWAAAAIVVVQLVGLNAWAWRERSTLAAKRDAARSILTQTFPNVRAVVDAPVQMDREVAALRQVTGGVSPRDLESMLGALAAVAPGRSATAVEYTGNELRVRGITSSADQAQAVAQSLRPRGYTAAQEGDVLVVRQGVQP